MSSAPGCSACFQSHQRLGTEQGGDAARSPPSPLHPWGLEGDLEMGGFVTPFGRAALLSMSLLAVLPTAISAAHI